MLNFGGFLSSNFWTNYRCQSSASIEDLLNNKDCTVDKLLDDDDCLQEFKNFNDKLIKYFDHDKLTVLIDYITVMPTKEAGHNRGHKYPFIAGEIFNCEINQILDKFFEAPIKVKSAPEPSAEDDEEKDEAEKEDSQSEDKKSESSDKDADKKEGAKNLEEAATEATEAASTTDTVDAEAKESNENPQTEEVKTTTAEEKPVEEATEKKEEEVKATEPAAEQDKNTQEPEAEQNDKKESSEEPAKEAKTSEPEEEESEQKAEEDLSTKETTMATLTTDGHEEEEAEAGNKYFLLERLFKFIRTEEDELNPVLSGYFCKLVSLLISRKQKQLVPYIFDKDSDVIECLLRHVEQKSISEILNKLLTQIDSDYEPELNASIQEKQQKAISVLISKLGPELHEENNLNGSAIIRDMCEIKEFYNLVCKKENIKQIVDHALSPMNASTKASKTSSLTVLNQIIYLHIEKMKKKDQSRSDAVKLDGNEDEDDMIVQQNSDDEANDDLEASNPNSTVAQANTLVEVLQEKIADIQEILRADHEGEMIQNSVTDEKYVPLGQQRLRTVELVHKMVQLRKDALYVSLGSSQIFKNIIDLVKKYPWNNFLQLKVMNIFNDVLENCENVQFKKDFLVSSGIGKAIVEMSEKASFTMESERLIRNGYMALVINIANKLQKKFDGSGNAEKTEDITVSDYLESVGEEWRAFVDSELKKSNENNNKTLGGSTTKNMDEDDDKADENYDVQMEKIMQRFTNFNRILSQNSATDDDDEEEDEDTQEEESKNFDEDDDGGKTNSTFSDNSSDAGVKIQKVEIKEAEPLKQDFIDNTFWKVGETQEYDIDALLEELDS